MLPIFLKNTADRIHHLRPSHNDAYFAARFQFQLAQALASEKGSLTVTDNHPGVQSHALQAAHCQFLGARYLADHPNPDTGPVTLLQHPQDRPVADLYVINHQFLLRPLQESCELLPRIDRAHNKLGAPGFIGLALGITIEEFAGFLHQVAVFGGNAKTAAAVHVEVSEVIGKNKQLLAVDQHHFAVIAN